MLRQRRHRIVEPAANRSHARRGGGDVGGIPRADEAGRNGPAAPGRVQRHLPAPVVELDPRRLHVGRRSRAKCDHVAAGMPREPGNDRIVGVENGRATSVGAGRRVQQIEQPAFRPPVALDAAVNVEMLVGHVGDNRAVEAEAVHAPELQRVRGHLEHRPIDPGINQLAQLPGDHRRLWGREAPGGRKPFAGEPRAHGGHRAGRVPLRLEHRSDQVAGRGLAVGSRHANRAQGQIGLAPQTPGPARPAPAGRPARAPDPRAREPRRSARPPRPPRRRRAPLVCRRGRRRAALVGRRSRRRDQLGASRSAPTRSARRPAGATQHPDRPSEDR